MAVEITRTPSSNGNQKIWTWSGWIKKATVGMGSGDYQMLFTANIGSGSRYTDVFFREDYFEVFGGVYSTSTTTVDINVSTNRKFRDPSAFYHLVVAVDTTQATASNRVKIYVNGVQETSLKNYQGSSVVYPAQNNNTFMNVTTAQNRIGASGGSYPFKGLMAHVHFVDGTAYTPSTFGETDSTSGIWKPKTNPSVTYGTNGYFLKFENSGAMGTDSSGNSNTFTVNGTLTQNVDTPDNNFATYNPLDNYYASSTFTNGNTTVATNTSNTTYNTTTLGIPSTMKCYWEVKFNSLHSANGEVGIVDEPTVGSSAGANRLYYQSFGISVNDYGQIWSNNSNTNITLGTLTTSDIVCFAWDGINQALYVRKNGDAWINSGDPTSGASKTGTVKSFTGTRTMFPAVGDQAGNHSVSTSTNFGNGFFGTTAISSAGTAASTTGKFEYDVPTGYQPLSTKGLNA